MDERTKVMKMMIMILNKKKHSLMTFSSPSCYYVGAGVPDAEEEPTEATGDLGRGDIGKEARLGNSVERGLHPTPGESVARSLSFLVAL